MCSLFWKENSFKSPKQERSILQLGGSLWGRCGGRQRFLGWGSGSLGSCGPSQGTNTAWSRQNSKWLVGLQPEGSGGTAHLLAQSRGTRPRAPSGIRVSPLLLPPPSSHKQPLSHSRAWRGRQGGGQYSLYSKKTEDGRGLAGGNGDIFSKNKTCRSLRVLLHRHHLA